MIFSALLLLSFSAHQIKGTFFGIRVKNQGHSSYGAPPQIPAAPQIVPPPTYGAEYGGGGQPSYYGNKGFSKPDIGPIVNELRNLKAGALRTGANALRFKGDLLHSGANAVDGLAANLANKPSPVGQLNFNKPGSYRVPNTTPANIGTLLFNSNPRPSYNPPPSNVVDAAAVIPAGMSTEQMAVMNEILKQMSTINNNVGSSNAVASGVGLNSAVVPVTDTGINPRLVPNNNGADVDEGLIEDFAVDFNRLRLSPLTLSASASAQQKKTVSQTFEGPRIQQCEEKLTQVVGDIFIGNEMIPDVIDKPPLYPLDLTYRTVRTFPGMRVTAETTRYKPMIQWPAEEGALYTLVVSNLDINTRQNRSLSEFWHWFVANIPGDSVDDGEVIFDLLFPLVLPEGNGDHRFGYFVMKQPTALDYRAEGGPTDSCSPQMSNGRGPRRSIKQFMRQYGLELTAATFLIIDSDETSLEIACRWQRCMGGQVFVRNLDCL